ncbi:hypothetical protein ACFLZX_05720, partial [Nanoarchaeota archaeon]
QPQRCIIDKKLLGEDFLDQMITKGNSESMWEFSRIVSRITELFPEHVNITTMTDAYQRIRDSVCTKLNGAEDSDQKTAEMRFFLMGFYNDFGLEPC